MSMKDIMRKHQGFKEFRIKDLKNLTKLESEDIYDEELTLVEFDIGNNKNGDYVVCQFAEHPDCYYFGKSVLLDLCKDIENDEEALDELHQYGLKIKLSTAVSKDSGREYENVNILGV